MLIVIYLSLLLGASNAASCDFILINITPVATNVCLEVDNFGLEGICENGIGYYKLYSNTDCTSESLLLTQQVDIYECQTTEICDVIFITAYSYLNSSICNNTPALTQLIFETGLTNKCLDLRNSQFPYYSSITINNTGIYLDGYNTSNCDDDSYITSLYQKNNDCIIEENDEYNSSLLLFEPLGFDPPIRCKDGLPCSCDEATNCNICHSGQGCSQCESNYFKLDANSQCQHCQNTFGNNCLHCADIHGCQQCKDGSIRTYNKKYDIYYCKDI